MIAKAKVLGFIWGGDWDNDGQTSDESLVGSPHLQYAYKGYGTDTFKTQGNAISLTVKTTTTKTSSSDNAAIVPYPAKLIKKGSTGKNVERIQRIVGVRSAGDFGPVAVKAYQKRKGLDVDGLVGKNTWDMMF
ncbi:hypothetical protein CWS01_14190 [Niallia nealsonii]|uniref:Peptidoglycan binding-like domain-containing protein n=2 Tax=Niallia nealsonii TaxID=115979 RepID=A0A2N0Z013_9BACI|nr:hypothetical protein CWS01_14190 [Niallia nealsonii]